LPTGTKKLYDYISYTWLIKTAGSVVGQL